MVQTYLRCYFSYDQNYLDELLSSARNDSTVETFTEIESGLNESLNNAMFSYQVSKPSQSAQRGNSYMPH